MPPNPQRRVHALLGMGLEDSILCRLNAHDLFVTQRHSSGEEIKISFINFSFQLSGIQLRIKEHSVAHLLIMDIKLGRPTKDNIIPVIIPLKISRHR